MSIKKEKKPDYQAHLFSFKYLLFDIIKWLGFWQCLIWYRIKKQYDGKEAKQRIKGKGIICSNHVAFSDPFILMCAFLSRRVHFVYMTELIKNKVQGWFYRHAFLAFPIDRNAPSFKTMKFLSEYVKGGNLLGIFPEGHIKKDNVVDSFKGGVIMIAYLSNAPIIPVYHKRRTSIWHRTELVIGKPFNVKERIGPTLNQDKLQQVAEELHEYELYLQSLYEEKKKS